MGPEPPRGRRDRRRGAGAGLGATSTSPLPFGCGDEAYADAFDEVVLPALREFVPTRSSAPPGTDASQFDANGRMGVSGDGLPPHRRP